MIGLTVLDLILISVLLGALAAFIIGRPNR
jgi:hypothetical protein